MFMQGSLDQCKKKTCTTMTTSIVFFQKELDTRFTCWMKVTFTGIKKNLCIQWRHLQLEIEAMFIHYGGKLVWARSAETVNAFMTKLILSTWLMAGNSLNLDIQKWHWHTVGYLTSRNSIKVFYCILKKSSLPIAKQKTAISWLILCTFDLFVLVDECI